MLGKNAHNRIKLLMRKHVKSVKENSHLLTEHTEKYPNLLWTDNFWQTWLQADKKVASATFDLEK